MAIRIEGASPYANCEALDRRAWRHKSASRSASTAKPSAPTIPWKKIGYTLPFLWFSGFFAGVGSILWLKGL